MNKVTKKAYAKINLTLDIIGRRTDGYHLISSVMQPINLFDEVRVCLIPESSKIKLNCSKFHLSGQKNIAYKSADYFFDVLDIKNKGISINITKNIPLNAGLGGGSADAAAVLIALNELYNTGLSVQSLMEIGAKLGADVPFCIYGKTALAEGIGEIITPLEPMKRCTLVLAKPCNKPSTKELYSKYDNLNIPYSSRRAQIFNPSCHNDLVAELGNDFLKVWGDTPVISALNYLKEYGAHGVNLTGSGPVVYGIFEDYAKANKCFKGFKNMNIKSFICETI